MTGRITRCVGVASTLLIAACSTGIKVTHVTSEETALVGNPWNLAMTQFTITITRHITACSPEVKGTVEAIPTSSVILDRQQRYVLQSKGWWSTSDITSNIATTGISTGLNAQSTDVTPVVISNVIGSIAQIAILAAAAQGPNQPAPQGERNQCTKEVSDAVEELYPKEGSKTVGLKKRVEKETADLAIATAKVTMLTAQQKIDRSFKKELLATLTEQAKIQEQLSSDQDKMTKDLNATTNVQVVTWPLHADEFRKDQSAYTIDPNVFAKWAPHADSQDASKKFSVYLALYRQNSLNGTWIAPKPSAPVDESVGVPVRLADLGRLLICVTGACPASLPAGPVTDKNHIATDIRVLQLGQVYVVPVAGGVFRSENGVIAIDSNGNPTTIQVVEKVAGASAATGAAKDIATQLASLPSQIRGAELAKTQAETNQLNANATLAAAQANAATAGQTAALGAQTSLITAQTNLATAQRNAGLPLQTTQMSDQTALLNAQSALANAQASAQFVDQTSALAAQATLTNAQAQQINAAAALARARASAP